MGFEMQRQSIKTTQQLFDQGLELQRSAAEMFLRNSFATQRSAQTWGLEFAHQMANSQFDSLESMMDDMEREFRSAMDDQFQRNADLLQQSLDDQFEQGADFVQQMLNAHVDGVQSAFTEAFDGQSMIDSQFRAISDSQDLIWEQFEPEVINAVDQVAEQQRTLVAQSMDAMFNPQESVERQTLNSS